MRFLMLMGKLPVRLTKRVRLERYLENAVLRILHVSPLSQDSKAVEVYRDSNRVCPFEYQSKGIGSPFRLVTYEILGEEIEPEQKQRNGPVWSILGQYTRAMSSPGHPSVLCAQNDAY